MADIPSGLLEACVVVGAACDKLREVHQVDTADSINGLMHGGDIHCSLLWA